MEGASDEFINMEKKKSHPLSKDGKNPHRDEGPKGFFSFKEGTRMI